MARILVTGTRTFNNYKYLRETLDRIISEHKYTRVEIITGGKSGADYLAEQYAKSKDYTLTVMPSQDIYGENADLIRYKVIHGYLAQEKDRLCVLFWDGKSKGTPLNYNLAKSRGTEVITVRYNE